MCFDSARGFHPHTFYCLDAQRARATTISQLDFWDLVYVHTDADSGIVSLHIARATERNILSRPTFYKLMRQAKESQALLPHDGGHAERGEYLCRLAAWPPAETIWKARGYVTEGWIALIRRAQTKIVLNLLYRLASHATQQHASNMLTFDISTLRRASKGWLGRPMPHKKLRDGVAHLATLGLVEERALPDGRRYCFYPLALQKAAPSRKALSEQVAESVGLNPDADAAWVRLLTDFVGIGGYRLREVSAIYTHLNRYLPDTSPTTLEALRAALHLRARWGQTHYRALVADFQRDYQKRKQIIQSLPLHLRIAADDVAIRRIAWPEGANWTRLDSVTLMCDLHGQKEAGELPLHLFLWWRGEMHPIGVYTPRTRHGIRRVVRFDLTPLLKDLRPDEPLTLIVATTALAPAGRLRALFILGRARAHGSGR